MIDRTLIDCPMRRMLQYVWFLAQLVDDDETWHICICMIRGLMNFPINGSEFIALTFLIDIARWRYD